MEQSRPEPIPNPAVRRLSLYLRQLETFQRKGRRTISSKQLGESLRLTDAQVRRYLTPIGFRTEPVRDGVHEVEIPTFRPDSEREIDVIEEVARHHGYANIERTVPSSPLVGSLTPYQRERRLVRDILAGAGCSEAFGLSAAPAPDKVFTNKYLPPKADRMVAK